MTSGAGPSGAEPVAALLALARAEAEALRRGDLAALDRLAARKAAWLSALRPQAGDAASLSELRERLQNNARLYQAALAGVALARARLSAAAEGARALKTYDRSGQLAASAGAAGGFARRV